MSFKQQFELVEELLLLWCCCVVYHVRIIQNSNHFKVEVGPPKVDNAAEHEDATFS